jgi:hypothetical protein
LNFIFIAIVFLLGCLYLSTNCFYKVGGFSQIVSDKIFSCIMVIGKISTICITVFFFELFILIFVFLIYKL